MWEGGGGGHPCFDSAGVLALRWRKMIVDHVTILTPSSVTDEGSDDE